MELSQEAEVESEDWLGFDWSGWSLLEPGTQKILAVPETPGFFRIKQIDRPGLELVGSTGRSLHERLIHLASKVNGEEKPGQPGTAAAHLWELKDFGGKFEFSYANPNIARSEIDRLGIENVMFSSHIQETCRSPTVNLDRQLADDQDSDLESLNWEKSFNFLEDDWLGLDWSNPRKLENRTEIDESKVVYRIWFPGYAPPLAYIGKSTNVANRLIKHEKKFGSRAKFSVAPLEANRKDVEAVLLAQHYLRTNTLPKGQDGRKNTFSWKLSH